VLVRGLIDQCELKDAHLDRPAMHKQGERIATWKDKKSKLWKTFN
jgi:hypothetical protein